MERDNPFGEYQPDLFPRLTRVAEFVSKLLKPVPHEAPLHMSNHYDRSRFEPSDGEAVEGQQQLDIFLDRSRR